MIEEMEEASENEFVIIAFQSKFFVKILLDFVDDMGTKKPEKKRDGNQLGHKDMDNIRAEP